MGAAVLNPRDTKGGLLVDTKLRTCKDASCKQQAWQVDLGHRGIDNEIVDLHADHQSADGVQIFTNNFLAEPRL